ncbi:hypothetical protein [Psychrobacter maritimus]|uniref:hypothetical protein n=1 Tax=Psychrobacter maritimus TaxID=256325 RepID=UPI003562C526
MSLSIYQRHLDNIPKQYKFLKLLRQPIYVIEISNNQLIAVCYYKDGSSKRHQVNADFSNRRMVIADFSQAVQAMTDLLLKFPQACICIEWLCSSECDRRAYRRFDQYRS